MYVRGQVAPSMLASKQLSCLYYHLAIFSNNWAAIVGLHGRWLPHFSEIVLPPPPLPRPHSFSRSMGSPGQLSKQINWYGVKLHTHENNCAT
jgi:hypothetical protein